MQTLASQLKDAIDRKLPEGFEQSLPTYEAGSSLATRAASGDAINAIAKVRTITLSEEVRTLRVQITQQLKILAISYHLITQAEIFGLVYVNLQWELH